MSLLYDALKRAQSERGAHVPSATPAATGEQNSAASAPNARDWRLEPVSTAASASTAPAGEAITPSSGMPASRAAGRAPWLAGAGLIVAVVFVAAGAYVWRELGRLEIKQPARAPAVAAAAPDRPQVAAPAPGNLASAKLENSLPPVPSVTTTLAAARSTPPQPVANVPDPRPARPTKTNAESAVLTLLSQRPPATNEPALKLTPSMRAAPEKASLTSAYAALSQGNLDQARKLYTDALTADPRNSDALMGLAATAARQSDAPTAVATVKRVLEVEPRNSYALALLASLASGERDTRALQQTVAGELSQLTTDHPARAALMQAQGALFARAGRWNEAQQAYFEALASDPRNPDLLYNVAVSLDHMGELRLARDYYGKALSAATSRSAQFSPAAAEQRLADINTQ